MDKRKEIYMDVAASTQPLRNVFYKVNEVLLNSYGNPSSIHEQGLKSKEVIEESTRIIARRLCCNEDEIHYTSGATMSNNIAIQGFVRANKNAVVICSAVEHNDIIEMVKWMRNDEPNGVLALTTPVNRDGFLKLDCLEQMLSSINGWSPKRKILLSVQMANSESGVIQDMHEICKVARKYSNVYIHTDATQYIPHAIVNLKNLDVDMLSMSGQKIGSIKGTGLLYVKKGTPLSPIIFGEQGFIGGTENVVGIAALGKAFEDLSWSAYDSYDVLRPRIEYLWDGIKEKIEDVFIVGSFDEDRRLPNNLYVCFKGVSGEALVSLLNEKGIYVSSGSACSSGTMKPSNVAMRYGFSSENAKSCVRFTIDKNVSYLDIDYVVENLVTLIDMLR